MKVSIAADCLVRAVGEEGVPLLCVRDDENFLLAAACAMISFWCTLQWKNEPEFQRLLLTTMRYHGGSEWKIAFETISAADSVLSVDVEEGA